MSPEDPAVNDDRWQGTGQFHPMKAWKRIARADRDREFEAKHPITRWQRFSIPVSIMALGTAALACVIYLLAWALSAPFA